VGAARAPPIALATLPPLRSRAIAQHADPTGLPQAPEVKTLTNSRIRLGVCAMSKKAESKPMKGAPLRRCAAAQAHRACAASTASAPGLPSGQARAPPTPRAPACAFPQRSWRAC
jgi:hypothetical protein